MLDQSKDELDRLEIDMVLQAVFVKYGMDFTDYAYSSIRRRLRNILIHYKLNYVSELIPIILHNPKVFQELLPYFSVTVTSFFRDPQVFNLINQEVIAWLATYPKIRIWHAGCATGEEVYSMAILLHEAGLLERSTIYATDMNAKSLEVARKGAYDASIIRKGQAAYFESGGQFSLMDYLDVEAHQIRLKSFLRQSIVWAHHNLVTDQVFGEMHLVFCRNTLIYFKHSLQERVLSLLNKSLCRHGFLVLGSKESLHFFNHSRDFIEVAQGSRVYKKLAINDYLPVIGEKILHQPIRGIVAIGASMGGLRILQTILAALPADFAFPILISQHIPAHEYSYLSQILSRSSDLVIKNVESGEVVLPGHVYIAPPDRHLLLNKDWTLQLSNDELVNFARPSIDVMFSSIASTASHLSIGVLLTGASKDGAKGLQAIVAQGGLGLVQSLESAEAKVMPQSAINLLGNKAEILSPFDMANRLIKLGIERMK